VNYRPIHFGKEMRRLLSDTTQRDVFRIDEATVGVTNGALSKAILAARPMHDFERIVFKPVMKTPVSKPIFSAVMKALGQDARRVANAEGPTAFDLRGVWPSRGYEYLHTRLYSSDPWAIRMMSHPVANRSRILQKTFETMSSRFLTKRSLPQDASALAKLAETLEGRERLIAIALYRRATQSLCMTVAGLVTSALWLCAPFDPDIRMRDNITETLRLLPPAWLLQRAPSKEFALLDDRIRVTDDVLLIPFLTQRDPAVWSEPEMFKPSRWDGIDNPEALDHYLPFGYASDRCWARELVLALAEHTLRETAKQSLRVDSAMQSVKMPMQTLLSIARLDIVAAR
jgi:cytochrome P450